LAVTRVKRLILVEIDALVAVCEPDWRLIVSQNFTGKNFRQGELVLIGTTLTPDRERQKCTYLVIHKDRLAHSRHENSITNGEVWKSGGMSPRFRYLRLMLHVRSKSATVSHPKHRSLEIPQGSYFLTFQSEVTSDPLEFENYMFLENSGCYIRQDSMTHYEGLPVTDDLTKLDLAKLDAIREKWLKNLTEPLEHDVLKQLFEELYRNLPIDCSPEIEFVSNPSKFEFPKPNQTLEERNATLKQAPSGSEYPYLGMLFSTLRKAKFPINPLFVVGERLEEVFCDAVNAPINHRLNEVYRCLRIFLQDESEQVVTCFFTENHGSVIEGLIACELATSNENTAFYLTFQQELGYFQKPNSNRLILCDRPIELHFDEEIRCHNDDRPAILFADGWSIWVNHGWVLTNPRYQVATRDWQSAWFLSETNSNMRHQILEAIGVKNVFTAIDAQCLSSWREYELYRVKNEIEPWHYLLVHDSSMKLVSIRQVPTKITLARSAIKWVNNGMDVKHFTDQS
jgi:hypothetical protein